MIIIYITILSVGCISFAPKFLNISVYPFISTVGVSEVGCDDQRGW